MSRGFFGRMAIRSRVRQIGQALVGGEVRRRMVIVVALMLAAQFSSGCRTVGNESAADSTASSVASRGDTSEVVQTAQLQLEQAVTIGDLTLRWLSVDDSRCPVGVQCVWEGQVTVDVEISLGEREPETVALSLRAGMEMENPIVDGRELRLLSVKPAPVNGVEVALEDLTAEIQIEKVSANDE